MARTLIFDIETVGEEWENFDELTKEQLLRWIEHTAWSEEEKTAKTRDLKDGLGFSPLTGRVVAIGMYDYELQKGAVYYVGDMDIHEEFEEGDFIFKQQEEKSLLEDFWHGARTYDTFVTFNGRGFDVPFIMLRSIACGVQPTKDLMEGRYLYQQRTVRHIDLQDQLTFYGAMGKRPSLHLFCRAFGIESPKAAGVAGDDVATLVREKKFLDIARYNVRDVKATTELYTKWLNYFATSTFFRTMGK